MSCTFTRTLRFAFVVIMSVVGVACGKFTPKPITPRDHVGVVVPVNPTLPNTDIGSLPLVEQKVGKGANTAYLGQVKIDNRRITFSAKTKSLRVRGQGTLQGSKPFEVDLFGIVGADGVAALLPLNSEAPLQTRGWAFCLDRNENGAYECRSFFIDVFVRDGATTYTEQYDSDSEADAAVVGESTEDEESESDHVTEPGRFKGYPDRTDELFRMRTPPEWLETSKHDDHDETKKKKSDTVKPEAAAAAIEPKATAIESKATATEPKAEPAKPAVTITRPEPTKPVKSSSGTSLSNWLKEKISNDKPKQEKPKSAPAASSASTQKSPHVDVRPTESVTPATDSTRTETSSQPQAAPAKTEISSVPAPKPPPVTTETPTIEPTTENQTAAMTIPENQAIGCHGPNPRARKCYGGLERASTLELESPYYVIENPKEERFFGTYFLVEFVGRLGKLVASLVPGNKLVVSDLSKKTGGQLARHKSHQNGLDGDFGYILETLTDRLVNIVEPNGTLSPAMKMAEQWTVFKRAVATNSVNMIFVNPEVKVGFCEFAKEIGEYDVEKETLRRLNQEEDHHDHWHLRLNCPDKNPRCRDAAPPANEHGCTLERTPNPKGRKTARVKKK